MDKTFLIFVAVGVGFLFLVTRFIGDLQEEDALQTHKYKEKKAYERYYQTDSALGELILDVTDADERTQVKIWNESPLREEMMSYFPNFSDMRSYVEMHIKGEPLRSKLLRHIEKIGGAYLAGELSLDEAKRKMLRL